MHLLSYGDQRLSPAENVKRPSGNQRLNPDLSNLNGAVTCEQKESPPGEVSGDGGFPTIGTTFRLYNGSAMRALSSIPADRQLSATSITGGRGRDMETAVNPMHPAAMPIGEPLPLRLAPRCCARTRAGNSCQSPRVKGKARCRMHGGAKGSGAPKGRANGRYRHGHFTCEAVQRRRALRTLIRDARAFLEEL
jgi:hypothetical protein